MRCIGPGILWVSISRKAELDGALFGLTGSGWSKQDEFDLYLLDSTFGSQLWDIGCKTDRCHHFVPAGTLLCCAALQIRYVVKTNRFWRRGGDLVKYWKNALFKQYWVFLNGSAKPCHGNYFFRICGGLKVGAGIWICHWFRLSSKIGGGQIDVGFDQREERVTIGLGSQTRTVTMSKRACNWTQSALCLNYADQLNRDAPWLFVKLRAMLDQLRYAASVHWVVSSADNNHSG